MSPSPMVLVVENRRKVGVRPDHPVLVEQGQLALRFQNALDHEHYVRAPGVVFVENERNRPLDRPRQHPLTEFGHLFAVLQDDGVLADEVDPAETWLSRFTRTSGQFSLAATCSMWVDFPVP